MEALPPATAALDTHMWPWGSRTLGRRLSEPRFQPEEGPVDPSGEEHEPIPPVMGSVLNRTLQAQLAELTFYRAEGEGEAFRVRDFSWMGVAYSSHPRDPLELRAGCDTGRFVDHLRKKRSESVWRGREIDIQELTASAVTTVLMSTVLNEYADTFPFDTWVLRRHLSATRFYSMRAENPSLFYCLGITYCIRNPITRHIAEKKFTLALTSIRKRAGNTTLILNDLPWQITTICAPLPRHLSHEGDEFRIAEWTVKCFLKIAQHWDDVLNEIDTQVHRKGAATIQQLGGTSARHECNPYVWALAIVENTLASLREQMHYIPLLTGEVLPHSWPTKRGCAALYEFEQLSKRIRRKMHEVALISETQPPTTEVKAEMQVKTFPIILVIAFFPSVVIMIMACIGAFVAAEVTPGMFLCSFTSVSALACAYIAGERKRNHSR